MKLPFNTILEKDLARGHIYFQVCVYNKNKTIHKTYQFSQSFTLDEIYNELKKKHIDKYLELEIIIN